MDVLIALVVLAFGFLLLIKGADFLVDGASSIATRFNISDLIIGLTIVSFGTSAPEVGVNINAAWAGSSDMVYGNVVGSNIYNTCLILGVAGMIYPLTISKTTLRFEGALSIGLVVLLILLSNDQYLFGATSNELSQLDGGILLVIFMLFIIRLATHTEPLEQNMKTNTPKTITRSVYVDLISVGGGIAGLVFGGQLVLDNAVFLAKTWGMTERVIGLTVVAIGTSLPELATSAVAALKKNSDIAIGNVIGSNIFNILLVLGASSLLTPISFNVSSNMDLFFLLSVSLLLICFILFNPIKEGVITQYKLARIPSAILFLLVVAYTVFLLI